MESKDLPTKFAPAERVPREHVYQQYQYFDSSPLIKKVVDTTPSIFTILNLNRQIVFFNQALLDFLGLDNEDDTILGLRPGEVLHCIHAFETKGGCGTTVFCRECGAANAILTSQKGKKDVRECRISQEQNHMIEALDLRVFASPFEFNSHEFTIFAILNISDEKRRKALEKIFFHDILNIASGLRGFIELLQEKSSDQDREFFEIIKELSHRIIEEIVAQKELIAAENNELSLKPKSVMAIDLLHEIALTYKNHEVAKERHIGVAVHTENISFNSDPLLLKRVLGNMLKNALEASQSGETVTLGYEKLNNTIQFWVHNPNYIPRNDQLQIFQRSFSTKGADRGLGTYSMKLLTERYLKGDISFVTSREKGTIFKAWYPISLPS